MVVDRSRLWKHCNIARIRPFSVVSQARPPLVLLFFLFLHFVAPTYRACPTFTCSTYIAEESDRSYIRREWRVTFSLPGGDRAADMATAASLHVGGLRFQFILLMCAGFQGGHQPHLFCNADVRFKYVVSCRFGPPCLTKRTHFLLALLLLLLLLLWLLFLPSFLVLLCVSYVFRGPASAVPQHAPRKERVLLQAPLRLDRVHRATLRGRGIVGAMGHVVTHTSAAAVA